MIKLNKKNYIKIGLFLIWIILIIFTFCTYKTLNIPILDYPDLITNFVGNYGIFGPIIMILISIIRPLIFFPATILTITAGALFGPWLGFITMLIGENLSANLSFIVGRYFGGNLTDKAVTESKKIKRLDCKFKENAFITVLTMRLIYFPFDMVGYASGICKAKHFQYALATFIGIIPGIATFIFLGSSFSDPRNLIIAGVFFIVGFFISKYLKKRKKLKK